MGGGVQYHIRCQIDTLEPDHGVRSLETRGSCSTFARELEGDVYYPQRQGSQDAGLRRGAGNR